MGYSINVKGRTIRALIRNFRDQLLNNEWILDDYNDQTATAQGDICKISRDMLNIISGNKPIDIINAAYTKKQKAAIEPLNTVCNILLLFLPDPPKFIT